MSFSTWLTGLWLGLGAVLLHQLCSVLRIGFGRDPARHPLRASLTDAAIMAALVFGLPLYLDLSWPQFAQQTPDLTAWIVVMCVLTVIAGLIRVLRRPARDV